MKDKRKEKEKNPPTIQHTYKKQNKKHTPRHKNVPITLDVFRLRRDQTREKTLHLTDMEHM